MLPHIFSFLPVISRRKRRRNYDIFLSRGESQHRLRLYAEAKIYGQKPAPTYLLFKEGKPRNFNLNNERTEKT